MLRHGWTPKEGEKFKAFMLVSAFDGEAFVCTGRYEKEGKWCVEAKRPGEKEAQFAFNQDTFVFVKA